MNKTEIQAEDAGTKIFSDFYSLFIQAVITEVIDIGWPKADLDLLAEDILRKEVKDLPKDIKLLSDKQLNFIELQSNIYNELFNEFLKAKYGEGFNAETYNGFLKSEYLQIYLDYVKDLELQKKDAVENLRKQIFKGWGVLGMDETKSQSGHNQQYKKQENLIAPKAINEHEPVDKGLSDNRMTTETLPIAKATVQEYALMHVYLAMQQGQSITQENKNKLAKKYGFQSGNYLRNQFTHYEAESNRLAINKSNKRSATVHLNRYKNLLVLLADKNAKAYEAAESDLDSLQKEYDKYYKI